METPVILSAVRTPIGKFQGGLAGLSAPELGAKVVAESIRRAGLDPKQIEEVIMGNVVQAGLGQNPARQAALRGGCDPRVAAMTINKVCGSGLKAVALAAQAIETGNSDIVVAGGMESMSNCPYLLPQARTGYRIGDGKLVDSMISDGLWDAYENFHMGMTGELVAEKYGITREEQDRFAVESHQKAVRARKSCFLESQILPIEVPQKKGDPVVIKYDESPREDTSLEALSKLKPAFKKDGTVTAGNAPGTNDGAAALVVTSERIAEKLGKPPLARIVAQAVSGVEPKWVMMAPVDAVNKLLQKTGWDREKDVDLFELNEAFAVAAIAVTRQLKLNPEKVNVNGGAVAIGHPIGASGARILVTLLYELARRNLKRGVAALCLGGGNAVALAVERG
ncbi:MAG: acetyl-CoA acetyltransferase [Acidobacteria bacterium 13_1_40CM_2_60_7]|nr:MAG: acetyl-CoA acetyltransferase [Acidobacteria bacterium 13_1_40CM_2_60_7]OLE85789.1 MAG: acetyl-CoA acetyltransferase [Acidobacteria bacterium 13_1_20CM_2_60_10]